MTAKLADHAVVLGTGMAGLLAARVLSDYYGKVTLVERDMLADSPMQRRGVPQGRHLHGLLSRGSQIMEQLFPGLLDDLSASGAQVIDDGDLSRVHTQIGPYRLDRTHRFADPSALVTYQASRPLLEFHIRQRVAALANVAFLDGHDVIEPTAPTSDRISGVLVVDRANGVSSVLNADLVVDAMGRAARTPAVLDNLGYGRPPELQSTSRATYFSQFLKMTDVGFAEKLVMVQPREDAALGGLIAYEDDTWILTVGGVKDGDVPPADLNGMLVRAAEFAPPHVLQALRSARPLGEVAAYRHSTAVWRRYDQMSRLPAGLLVIGDALCTLNPVHGQGMTVAALQALALRDTLAGGELDIPRRFFRAAAEVIGPTWAMNRARQRRPSPSARRSPSKRVAAWATTKVLLAAADDIVLTERIFRVTSLVDPPTRLRDPALLGRALIKGLRWGSRRRSPGSTSRIRDAVPPRPDSRPIRTKPALAPCSETR
jgi:2-polyprenyl-6-methoxyphenol hydroxylase-like FAD-dependent oxidoreductase